ncbi:MAG: DEAD/DEAH box helicase [Vampirovibrionia bacterium]|jgi:superfamily II DNA or RNA helicase
MLEDSLFFKVICRLGLFDIQSLIDSSVFEIIYTQHSTLSKKELVKILCEIYPLEDLINDKPKRKIIIDALNEEEVGELVQSLNIIQEPQINLWDSISKFRFSNNTDKQTLYEFFELDYNDNENTLDSENKGEEVQAQEVIKASYSLFPHQEEVIKRIEEISKTEKRVLLHMPTGAGKTRTAMNIICNYLRNSFSNRSNQLIIWLADTEELCDQACEEFTKAWSFLGSSPINLFRLYSSYSLDLNEIKSGFLVAGLAKLRSKFDQSQEDKLNFARRCSLIIFDEAHKVIAPTYSDIVELINIISNARVIGLSATPGRSTYDESENDKLAAFFNYQKVGLEIKNYPNPIEYLQVEGYLSKVQYHDINNGANYLTKEDLANIENQNEIPSYILEKLSKDTQRNLHLISIILDKVLENKKIIVFACSVAHAQGLYALLKYKNIPVGIVSSKINNNLRQKTIKEYKENLIKVIINFGVLTTGFDDPQTNVAIITRPTKSLTLYSQMVGRASRGIKVGGNLSSEIYTVIDDAIPGFKNLAKAYQHWEKDWDTKEGVLI